MEIKVVALRVAAEDALAIEHTLSNVSSSDTLGTCMSRFFEEALRIHRALESSSSGSSSRSSGQRRVAEVMWRTQARLVHAGRVYGMEHVHSETLESLNIANGAILRLLPLPNVRFIEVELREDERQDGNVPLPSAPQAERSPIHVRELHPRGAMSSGGVRVCVFGSHFQEGARVKFGTIVVPAIRHSHDLLVCTAPAHEPGVVSVEVEISPMRNGGVRRARKKQSEADSEFSDPSDYTQDGVSFTYVSLADLDGTLALVCESGVKPFGQEVCNDEEQAASVNNQPPPGMT
ncbi:hypothetical protein FVE85_5865 [Porphyridium purpureum]|uniref:IPT/TIG domain-containing protein n=1 Tax=Porphyridium purpureum TaxID=35688 RepID=A0A5J4Z4X9_PORPP|nr:hypothetical protein FVE85_5865 [Porphyridium purpureum]|eukprot:POR7395..scf295_1